MEGADFDLEAVPVRVTNINFDGLGRTKGDYVGSAASNVFQAKTFGELILRVGQAQESLRRLEVFRDVATIIDVDKTSTDTNTAKSGDEDTYNVTFVVKEFGRVAASAKTQMGGQADAQVTGGLRMPNIFGRGERLEAEYSYSSSKEKNTEISLTKPLVQIPKASVKGSLFHSKSSNPLTSYHNTNLGSLITFHRCNTESPLHTTHHKVEYEGTWRQIIPFNSSTPFEVRADCGHSFKSAIRYVYTLDGRDRDQSSFPTGGYYLNLLQEIAGLFGDVKYHKYNIDLQHFISLPLSLVFQSSFRVGVITPFSSKEKSCSILDRFFSGGPYSLRGFTQRGVNSGTHGISVGDLTYWSTAFHLYSPFPYLNKKYPMVQNFRLHFFANAGNLADKLLTENTIRNMRIAYGVGIAVGLGNFGRVEVNYCCPVKHSNMDKCLNGLQLGIGVHFL